jgi:ubiquinone/menaquinone biosynthesis C-methylase UbiE
MKKAYLDYYARQNIIPVHQDIEDLDRHFKRRQALYQTLGIVPSMVEGRRVVELGPGTGDNAIYIDSLKPSEYYLVDGNPASIKEMQKKKEAKSFSEKTKIIESNILDFHKEKYFDFVICEGAVPGQSNPKDFLRHVASLTKVGGVLVFTTINATSVLADICRRVVKPLVASRFNSFDENLHFLTDFFKEDLKMLYGMSRRHEDWILDQILHPWNDELFPIPMALDAIVDSFDFHSSSPKFVADWRWYKTIIDDDPGFNNSLLRSYDGNSAWLIDCRIDPASTAQCDGRELERLCLEAYWHHVDAWHSDSNKSVENFLLSLNKISKYIAGDMPATAKSINAFIEGAEQIRKGIEPSSLKEFRGFFGRGQQYLSFIRRH